MRQNILFGTSRLQGPADVFAAEIMRSFTSRPGYHANSYDAASHGWVVKLHFQFMKRQLYRDGRATLLSRLQKSTCVFSPLAITHACIVARVSEHEEPNRKSKLSARVCFTTKEYMINTSEETAKYYWTLASPLLIIRNRWLSIMLS